MDFYKNFAAFLEPSFLRAVVPFFSVGRDCNLSIIFGGVSSKNIYCAVGCRERADLLLAFPGGLAAQGAAGVVVEPVLDLITVFLLQFGEIGAFGEEAANHAVHALIGAAFAGRVWMAVVDGGYSFHAAGPDISNL